MIFLEHSVAVGLITVIVSEEIHPVGPSIHTRRNLRDLPKGGSAAKEK